jgi:hypothetical protein
LGRAPTAKRGDPESPAILIWGEFVTSPSLSGEATAKDPDSSSEIERPPTGDASEFEAPPVDEILRIELDEKESEDAVLIHTFEKIETADEYAGGSRDTDGADELADQLEALEEVDLREVMRGGEQAHSLLRSNISLSSDSWVDGQRVLDVSRDSAFVLGEVARNFGDRIQILAFASHTRNHCRVWEICGWDDSWEIGRARLGALEPQGYTRIGPALRHATAELAAEPADARLLLLLSDGKPTDYDRYEGRYGIADVRHALREVERVGVSPHALAVDRIACDYLPAMFGPRGWHILPHPDRLPEVLTTVYGRLTDR